MTDRLADITARIDGIGQLGQVVNAMRGIAAARAQQANAQLPAADSHAATIAAAIGEVLTLLPSRNLDTVATFRSAHHAIVLLDYSKDGSVECDFCVWTMHTPGVKWELLDAFFDSDWFRQHRAEYEWLWYPDDDLARARLQPASALRPLARHGR